MSTRIGVRRFTYGLVGFFGLFLLTVLGSMPSFVHSGRYIPKAVFVFGSGALALVSVIGFVACLIGLVAALVVRDPTLPSQHGHASQAHRPEESGA